MYVLLSTQLRLYAFIMMIDIGTFAAHLHRQGATKMGSILVSRKWKYVWVRVDGVGHARGAAAYTAQTMPTGGGVQA